MSLVNTYDPDQAGFKLGSELVQLTPSDVKDIMGLPIEGKEVNMTSCGREKTRSSLTLSEVENRLKQKDGPADDSFLRDFFMFCHKVLFDPDTNPAIPAKVQRLVENVGDLHLMNWGVYTLKNLQDGLAAYKRQGNNPTPGSTPKGSLILLQVINFHFITSFRTSIWIHTGYV